MPREARKTSGTKVYHVILKGNDSQDIFLDKQDYKKFLKEITNTKEKFNYEVYAYCLMNNHVHMVLYDKKEKISKAMQSLAISYSNYFSKKYEKTGHLFQNRFLSKNVETQEYLMQVIRYIHKNPEKAGISDLRNYTWSSFNEYIKEEKIITRQKFLSLFGNTMQEQIKNFKEFHIKGKEEINDYLEYEIKEKLTDEELIKQIQILFKITKVTKIKEYNTKIRNEKLRELKKIKGTSKSQLARVLGINRKQIERALKK